MAFIVSLLALSAVLSPFHTLGITSPSFTPSLRSSPAGIDLEEVQVNLFINQLAIMSILNETRASSGPNCEVNEGEIQQLKQSLASLNDTVTAQGPASELNEREIQEMKKSLASLNDALSAQGRDIEEQKREIEEQKTVNEELKREIEEQKTGNEEQKREIEEQKTWNEEQKREIEEQKTWNEEQKREIEEQKTWNEEQKREIEEQKTWNEEQKREIEEQKTRNEELKREIEEQKTENEEQKTDIEQLKKIIATTNEEDCSVKGDLHVNDDCSISVYHRGLLHPYQGSSFPNVSFSDLLAKNCIHLERSHKSWDAARANCVALGGDLFVAGDFMGAMQYLVEQNRSPGLTYWPWVGVKRREWINGRPVASGEWYASNPDGPLDSCAYVDGNGLDDSACSNPWTSLCVKGTTY